jgi:hypothetical protein
MMQWLDRFCRYKTFGAKITSNGVTVKKLRKEKWRRRAQDAEAALGATAASRTGGGGSSIRAKEMTSEVGQAGPDGPHRLGWLGQSKRPKPCWAGAVWGGEKRWAASRIGPKTILGCPEKMKMTFRFYIQGMIFKFKF